MSTRPEPLHGTLWRRERGIFADASSCLWFHVEGDKLFYYKNEGCLEHLGHYDLSAPHTTVHPTTYGRPVPPDGRVQVRFEFQLNVARSRKSGEGFTVFLAAGSYEMMWKWVDGLLHWITLFAAERRLRRECSEPQDRPTATFVKGPVPQKIGRAHV